MPSSLPSQQIKQAQQLDSEHCTETVRTAPGPQSPAAALVT